jgi:hypothetical protein
MSAALERHKLQSSSLPFRGFLIDWFGAQQGAEVFDVYESSLASVTRRAFITGNGEIKFNRSCCTKQSIVR